MSGVILNGDCRVLMPGQGLFDLVFADPPYGETSLSWDKRLDGWHQLACDICRPGGSLWVCGSLRFFMHQASAFAAAGWRLAQDIVWEKQNGSNFHADRCKRVHEHIVQFYRSDAAWADVYNEVQYTQDATARTVRRKKRPPHTGNIDAGHYTSVDGGPRLLRSVWHIRNCHGRAIHPTEKPTELLEILCRMSCPPGGRIADLFAGSGSLGEAAAITGREYVGCEIDPEMATKAIARLSGSLFGRGGVAA